MTGFQLSWSLENNKLSQFNQLTGLSVDSEPGEVAPRYSNPHLIRMVELASQARQKKLSEKTMMKLVSEVKANIIINGTLHCAIMCLNGQVKSDHYSTVFGDFNLGVAKNHSQGIVTDEDIAVGFKLFSAFVDCSESVAPVSTKPSPHQEPQDNHTGHN